MYDFFISSSIPDLLIITTTAFFSISYTILTIFENYSYIFFDIFIYLL